jgi:hypothetical protein
MDYACRLSGTKVYHLSPLCNHTRSNIDGIGDRRERNCPFCTIETQSECPVRRTYFDLRTDTPKYTRQTACERCGHFFCWKLLKLSHFQTGFLWSQIRLKIHTN